MKGGLRSRYLYYSIKNGASASTANVLPPPVHSPSSPNPPTLSGSTLAVIPSPSSATSATTAAPTQQSSSSPLLVLHLRPLHLQEMDRDGVLKAVNSDLKNMNRHQRPFVEAVQHALEGASMDLDLAVASMGVAVRNMPYR